MSNPCFYDTNLVDIFAAAKMRSNWKILPLLKLEIKIIVFFGKAKL